MTGRDVAPLNPEDGGGGKRKSRLDSQVSRQRASLHHSTGDQVSDTGGRCSPKRCAEEGERSALGVGDGLVAMPLGASTLNKGLIEDLNLSSLYWFHALEASFILSGPFVTSV